MERAPAKVTRPRAAAAVQRRRLHRALDAALKGGGAAWIAAQPGSGKTTLLASWIEARRLPAVWLRLDAGDADVATFFHYLHLAARAATRRRLSLPAFRPGYEIDLFARNAFRVLLAALPRGTVLVLDDCHEIPADAPLNGALRAAIEELAPGVTMVLSSRSPPPPSLARPRANGALRVLGDRALELTRAEALSLARARGFRGSASRVEVLRRAVDGWAAGLILALAAAEGQPAEVDVRAATFDYFAGEVFERLDPATRRVLLEAALLDVPTGELVARVTGDPGAGRLLSGLARRGLFTFRHEAGAPAFEFHALFREFLLTRGREELPPGRADAVRRAAATALAEGGGAGAEQAIGLFQRAGAHEQAAALVAREAGAALRAGRAGTVLRWIAGLSPAVRGADPWIRCWEGAARAPREPAAARALLEPALEAFEAQGDAAGVWMSWTAIVESILFEGCDFTPLGPRIAELERLRARYGFPTREVELHVTLVAVAVYAHLAPEHPNLAPWAERALEVALAPGEARFRLVAGAYTLLHQAWWLGQFERNRPLVEALGPLAREAAADPLAAILWLSVEAPFHAGVGDPGAAARCADEARRLAAKSGVHLWDVVLHAQGIWTALGDDDVHAAREETAALRKNARPGNRMDQAFVQIYDGLIALRAGDLEAATRHATDGGALAGATCFSTAQVLSKAVLARGHTLSGREDASRAALAAARAYCAPLGSACFEQVLDLIEAERQLRAGDAGEGHATLARALSHARAGIAHAQYLFSREELARLAAEALRAGIEVGAARDLVRVRRLSPPASAGAEWPREVRIRALGAFSVEREGVVVGGAARGPQRPLELLRVLVALGGREVPEERVSEALWPDSDGDVAHHALETALYRLRRAIGPEAVVQRARRLSISAERCWVDALELDARLSDQLAALQARRGGTPPSAADTARISELYAGPLLAERDAPWAVEAREALRRKLARWLDALERADGAPAVVVQLRGELAARDDALAAGSLPAAALRRMA